MATAAPSPIDLSPSKERDDYVRLARLIICGGTTVLIALFDTYHPPADLAKNLNHWKTHLETHARLLEPQKQLLYPVSGDPVSKNFDLSLLYKLLRNICGLTEPVCKWNGRPLDGDISLEDDIVRLRNYRNEVYGHVSSEMAISSEDFTKYWKDISEALLRINNAIPNKLDPSNLQEQMHKLKDDSITHDEMRVILKEIQETLDGHTEALGRLENQGDGLYKQIESLQDTFNKTTFQQTQAPKSDLNMNNTTTQKDNNIHINIMNNKNTNINININNKSREIRTKNNFLNINPLLERLGLGGSAIKAPPVIPPLPAPLSGNSGQERDNLKFQRSQSLPTTAPKSQQPKTYVCERSLSLRDLAFEETVLANNDQQVNNAFQQEQDAKYSFEEENTERDNFQMPSSRPVGNHEPSAFQEYCTYPRGERPRSYEELNQFEPSLAQASPLQTTNPTNQNITPQSMSFSQHREIEQSDSHFPEVNSPPATVPRFDGNVSRRRSSDDWRFLNESVPLKTPSPLLSSQNSTLMSQSTSPYTDESSRRRSSSFEENQESCTPQNGRVLHINIRICGNRNLVRIHLGQLISQSLSYDVQTDKQFRSYLLQSRQLTIEKVDNQDDIHCCIGVSADDLESLENIWRDCVTNDLREIIKETVLPADFDGKLEVTIDGKEYEQCCKRLTPKDLGEMRSYHSQSFGFNQTQEEDVVFSPRCQSLGELSSSSKTASDELYLLLCKHGGKLQYTEVMKQLSENGRTEIEKAMIQKNMDTRFRILPGNVIQARLNFCAKSTSECNQLNCPNLHLCRYHLLAGCTFPGNCINSHDITDHHTNRIFRDANLSSLTADERSNLLKNIAYTVPEICRFYNTPGNNSTCKNNDHCRYLHVCKHWVNGKCLFGKPKCIRAHTFDNPTTQKILKESNLRELSEHEIKEKLIKQNI